MESERVRIESIQAFQPDTPDCPKDWRLSLGQIFVRVTLDNGVSGIGIGGGGLAGINVITSCLREIVLSVEFEHPKELHALMCKESMFFGRKGLVVMALSGLDLAVWDAYAKLHNLPIAKILNPDIDISKPVPMYKTVWTTDDAVEAIESGWQAVKLHVEGMGENPDSSLIRAAVESTRSHLGDGPPIMIDAFGRWSVEEALEVAHEIKEFGIDWLEEPVMPNEVRDYRELNRTCPIPIAAGEHEYLLDGFRDAVELGLFDIFQPDINWCGGLTSLLEIYQLANTHNIRVVPHRGAEPYALHAILACDNSPLAESERHWFSGRFGFPESDNGHVCLEDKPGFGVQVNWPDLA